MFIRAVRNLQDSGILRAITLAEIRELMQRLDTASLSEIQAAADPDTAIRALFSNPDWNTSEVMVPVEDVVNKKAAKEVSEQAKTRSSATRTRPGITADIHTGRTNSIRKLISQIDEAVQSHAVHDNTDSPVLTHTSTVHLGEYITISVHGLPSTHNVLLRRLAAGILSGDLPD